jgi:hypothetical protein
MRHRILGGTGLSVPPGSAPAEMGFYRWKPGALRAQAIQDDAQAGF